MTWTAGLADGELAQSITNPDRQARVLADLAKAAAAAGDLDRAQALASRRGSGPVDH